jgi:hypothetical protein
MGMFWLLFYTVISLIIVASYFISAEVYKVLVKNGKGSAKTVRVLTFIGSFLVLLVVIAYVFLANLRFER